MYSYTYSYGSQVFLWLPCLTLPPSYRAFLYVFLWIQRTPMAAMLDPPPNYRVFLYVFRWIESIPMAAMFDPPCKFPFIHVRIPMDATYSYGCRACPSPPMDPKCFYGC